MAELDPKSTTLLNESNLCDTCLLIDKTPNLGNIDRGYDIVFSRPAVEVVKTMNSGCKCCAFFCKLVFKDLPPISDIHEGMTFPALEYNLVFETSLRFYLDGTKVTFQLEIVRVSSAYVEYRASSLCCSSIEEITALSCVTPNEFFPDDRHSFRQRPRPVFRIPDSTETLLIIQRWLKACDGHACCSRSVDVELPTRVVDVSVASQPKLMDSKGITGQYTILSHCWGAQDKVFKTTTLNLKDHLMALPDALLPANFRDAISFTHKLGFKYVWIDALCIIQDDLSDWEREASQMAEYYNKASLMLSASHAVESADGFLHERIHLESPLFGEKQQYYLRQKIFEHRELNHLQVNRRGWTLQERLLAPRTLHFTVDGVLFECGTGIFSEGYFELYNYRLASHHMRARVQLIIEPELYEANKEETKVDYNYYQIWTSCVSDYTSRRLTVRSDRLPAIAGLAKKFSMLGLGAYLAGHWENDIFRSLCWRQDLDEAAPSTVIPQITTTYIAPSWSWASVDRKISVEQTFWKIEPEGFKCSPTQVDEFEHWKERYGPILISWTISALSHGDNYLGVGPGSYIEIEGYCRTLFIDDFPISWDRYQMVYGPKGPVLRSVQFDNDHRGHNPYMSSYLSSSKSKYSREYTICQMSKEYTSERAVFALILKPIMTARPSNAYIRVGVCTLGNYNLGAFLDEERFASNAGWPAHDHPRQRDGKLAELENEEWHPEKWNKQRLRIY